MLAAIIGVGAGFLLIAFTPADAFPLALGGLFVVGMISTISGGLYPVMIQTVVAPEMQGRVFSIFGTLVSGMLALGMITAGPIADAAGVRVPYFIGGLAQVLIGAAGFMLPALLRIEEKPTRPAVETAPIA
jgi:DHA3 family macrolide efflux protein-like MFS transporter